MPPLPDIYRKLASTNTIVVLSSEAIIPMIIACHQFVTLCCLISSNYYICHDALL